MTAHSTLMKGWISKASPGETMKIGAIMKSAVYRHPMVLSICMTHSFARIIFILLCKQSLWGKKHFLTDYTSLDLETTCHLSTRSLLQQFRRTEKLITKSF